jgi:hypothetical protein
MTLRGYHRRLCFQFGLGCCEHYRTGALGGKTVLFTIKSALRTRLPSRASESATTRTGMLQGHWHGSGWKLYDALNVDIMSCDSLIALVFNTNIR